MFYPTTCVRLRYGYLKDMLSGFSREYDYPHCQIPPRRTPYCQVQLGWWICLPSRYLACTSSSSRWLQLPLSVIPSHIYGYRNLYLLSIDYAFRPRLRSRLTQSGRTFLWKPWVFGAWDSHPRSATHTGILSSMISTRPFGRTSPFMERSPTIPWDP